MHTSESETKLTLPVLVPRDPSGWGGRTKNNTKNGGMVEKAQALRNNSRIDIIYRTVCSEGRNYN